MTQQEKDVVKWSCFVMMLGKVLLLASLFIGDPTALPPRLFLGGVLASFGLLSCFLIVFLIVLSRSRQRQTRGEDWLIESLPEKPGAFESWQEHRF